MGGLLVLTKFNEMKRSRLRYHYTQYFGDQHTVFSEISPIAQYRSLRLDYEFGSAIFKFIRDEKERGDL